MFVDSSAWIAYLRGTGSPAHLALRGAIERQEPLTVCDPILMEVLAGGRSESHVRDLRRLLAIARHASTLPQDFDTAAILFRTGRRQGIIVRKIIDCLIAAVALREDLPVLHEDADFDALAQIAPLRTRRR